MADSNTYDELLRLDRQHEVNHQSVTLHESGLMDGGGVGTRAYKGAVTARDRTRKQFNDLLNTLDTEELQEFQAYRRTARAAESA